MESQKTIMMKMIVTGAAGRMGRRLVAHIAEAEDMILVGATERSGSDFIGVDAGSLAGVKKLNVPIKDSIADSIADADAVIDFSTGGVIENAKLAAAHHVAIVIGTTALTADEKAQLKELGNNGAKIVFASNYSIGVNLLFYLSGIASKILGEDFDMEVVEMHHNQKKDAPSGTAVTLAEILCKSRGLNYEQDVRHGREGIVGARTKHEIGMHSIRGGDVVGDHTVIFAAQGERVELGHKASSRDTFAKGALRAARFLKEAPAGLYDMQDVLGLK